MTPAFRKLSLALVVFALLQLSFSVPVDAAHGSTASSHARRSLTLKKPVTVDRSENPVLRDLAHKDARDDGPFGGLLGECSPSLLYLGISVDAGFGHCRWKRSSSHNLVIHQI